MTKDDMKKVKPLRDIVAFIYKAPKLKSKIIIPDTVMRLKLEKGRFIACQVIAVGPKVTQVKPKDWIVVNEYEPINFSGAWTENFIYYVEESHIPGKLDGYKGDQMPVLGGGGIDN